MQIAARQAGEIRNFEADIIRADGSVCRELGHAVPLFDDNGRVRGSLGVFVDITERRRIEEALRESEQRFRNMAENAPVMIWVTNADGSCTYVNRQWCEFTGTPLEDNLGLAWTHRTHPGRSEICRRHVHRGPRRAHPLSTRVSFAPARWRVAMGCRFRHSAVRGRRLVPWIHRISDRHHGT